MYFAKLSDHPLTFAHLKEMGMSDDIEHIELDDTEVAAERAHIDEPGQHPDDSVEDKDARAEARCIWRKYGVPLQKDGALPAQQEEVTLRNLDAIRSAVKEVTIVSVPKIESSAKAVVDGLIAHSSQVMDGLEKGFSDSVLAMKNVEMSAEVRWKDAKDELAFLKKWALRFAIGLVALLVILIVVTAFSARAHAQIDVIRLQSNTGTSVGTLAAPFTFKAGANCSWTKSGSTVTFDCSSGSGLPSGCSSTVSGNITCTTSFVSGSNFFIFGAAASTYDPEIQIYFDPSLSAKNVIFGKSTVQQDGLFSGIEADVTSTVDANGVHCTTVGSPSADALASNNVARGCLGEAWHTNAQQLTRLTGVEGVAYNYASAGPPARVTYLVGVQAFSNFANGPVTYNFGVNARDEHGVGDTLNAAYHADDQGGLTKDWVTYFEGGKSFWAQGTNGISVLAMKRATDTLPTGKFLDFQNAAGSSLANIGIDGTFDASGFKKSGVALASIHLADFSATPATTAGQIPIWDGSKFVPGDPLVQGLTAHDAVGSSTNPVAIGGFASAAAPTNVSADGDIVNGWFLRNGAQATVLTAGGALMPGDATNGLKVQVTTAPSTAVTNTGTFAVQAAVADGADVTLGAKADAKSTATDTTAISAMSVLKEISAMEQAPASRAVTNAGTFAVQITANSSVNVAQVGGTAVVADPCQANTKSYFSTSGTASVKLITGTSAKKTYICSLNIVVAAAQNIGIVEGTGSTCGTGTATYPGMSGGTTAAGGWNFAANGGLTFGNGASALGQATTNADDVCALVANSVQTNISGSYVQQ